MSSGIDYGFNSFFGNSNSGGNTGFTGNSSNWESSALPTLDSFQSMQGYGGAGGSTGGGGAAGSTGGLGSTGSTGGSGGLGGAGGLPGIASAVTGLFTDFAGMGLDIAGFKEGKKMNAFQREYARKDYMARMNMANRAIEKDAYNSMALHGGDGPRGYDSIQQYIKKFGINA